MARRPPAQRMPRMRIKLPSNLPTDPASAYRMGVRDGMKAGGRKGGKNRAASLTPKRRSEIARKGALAKHAKYKIYLLDAKQKQDRIRA